MVARAVAKEGRLLDAGKDLRAQHGVRFDMGVLFVGEFARLVDDALTDAYFAHVVQKRRKIDMVAFLLGKPGFLRYRLGIDCHAGRMPAGIGVLCVDGVRQRLDRLLKQCRLLLLGVLQKGKLVRTCPFRRFAEGSQRMGIENDDDDRRNDGHQRKSVKEDLRDRRRHRQSQTDDHRKHQFFVKAFAVPQNGEFLQNDHNERYDGTEQVPRPAIIMVLRVKIIIYVGKLRNCKQHDADDEDHLAGKQCRRLFFELSVCLIEIGQIPGDQKRDEQAQKILRAVVEANHKRAQPRHVAVVGGSHAIDDQQQHGGNFHRRQNILCFALQSFGCEGHYRKDPAHSAQKEHYFLLMNDQKFHFSPFQRL